MILLLRY